MWRKLVWKGGGKSPPPRGGDFGAGGESAPSERGGGVEQTFFSASTPPGGGATKWLILALPHCFVGARTQTIFSFVNTKVKNCFRWHVYLLKSIFQEEIAAASWLARPAARPVDYCFWVIDVRESIHKVYKPKICDWYFGNWIDAVVLFFRGVLWR